jgi:hypothetical protein
LFVFFVVVFWFSVHGHIFALVVMVCGTEFTVLIVSGFIKVTYYIEKKLKKKNEYLKILNTATLFYNY